MLKQSERNKTVKRSTKLNLKMKLRLINNSLFCEIKNIYPLLKGLHLLIYYIHRNYFPLERFRTQSTQEYWKRS